jgi:hypothetical protein
MKLGNSLPSSSHSNKLYNKIKKEVEKDTGNYFSDEITYKNISNSQNYYIENKELIVFFQHYEIAPYAAGIPEFKIPFTYR